MLVVLRGSSDGLTSIVDDDIKTSKRVLDVGTEILELCQIAEVKSKALQTILPVFEIFFKRVASCTICSKAAGGDDSGTAPQQLQCDAVSNLDASPRDHSNTSYEVANFIAFLVIERGAGGAKLVIKKVQLPERPLAGVAVNGYVQLPSFTLLCSSLLLLSSQLDRPIGHAMHLDLGHSVFNFTHVCEQQRMPPICQGRRGIVELLKL
mmetsp:Transcript_64705/g.104711  ORF Transcript_64705/g.104711 Transcript_64705/m.104711 type:complete len:208 (-) Transcript_64705:480-1103(-)